ncbi:beta-ketoacyl synthase N-terminal-like domain-containing protein, partial [Singulisphaera rosea]
MPERIVVVGHAAVTCLGPDLETTWRGLISGLSGIRRHERLSADAFLQDVAGMVEDFGPGSSREDPAIAKLEVRSIHLALAAAKAAWTGA